MVIFRIEENRCGVLQYALGFHNKRVLARKCFDDLAAENKNRLGSHMAYEAQQFDCRLLVAEKREGELQPLDLFPDLSDHRLHDLIREIDLAEFVEVLVE